MKFLSRIFAIFVIAARRLIAQRGLAIATAVGLIVSVSLVMSIPLYTDAVYYQILQDELGASDDSSLQRPPFAFMFRYVGSLNGAVDLEDTEQADTYLTGPAIETLGIPHEMTVRYFRTDNFRLFPTADLEYADIKDPLEWVSFATVSDVESYITLLEGAMPAPSGNDQTAPVDVLVTKQLADALGLQTGEQYVTFQSSASTDSARAVQVPIRIAGIWQAIDPDDPYWFYRQSVFETQLFVPEETFVNRLSPFIEDEVAQALWYLIMDGSAINTDDVGALVNNITLVNQRTTSLLANTRLEYSPFEPLQRYRRSSRFLNILLYAFSIPIVGLLFAFIGVVVGLAVERQRNEIAVLRSRGATVLQVLGIALLQAIILGAVALAGGAFVSQSIAKLIGSTRSFLDFTVETDLRIIVTNTALRFGVYAVLVAVVAQVIPSIGAAKHTIITYKQERARTLRPPLWQRIGLDFLLMIPAGYGAYLLRQQGAITDNTSSASNSSLFDNPLLFLVPALTTLALTLLLLRILPRIMAALAWIAARSNSVGFLLASRYLARDPGSYSAPLLLLILTLSLSIFTASLALTLDNHLFDRTYYKVGSDVRLAELGVFEDEAAAVGEPGAPAAGAAAATANSDDSAIPESRWVFIPVDEHLKVDGIKAAARVGDFNGRLQLQDSWQDAKFIGIDRIDFPNSSYWRRDFAPASLGALMNALAVTPSGILLPRLTMQQYSVKVGDPINVQVSSFTYGAQMVMTVVGEIDYFPTWYAEDDGPLIVGNLDYLFEQFGGQVPYDVWSATEPGIDYETMSDELGDLDLRVLDYQASRQRIASAQREPSRQGLFGVLSVGFLAAALLTVLGFLLYALFSFRRRFIELGTLRAIGLSPGQMTTFLAWELIFLIALGLTAGTFLGILISQIFIPSLQIGSAATDLIPPFVVEIAWDAVTRIYALFIALFAIALLVLAVLLLRMKIFQAIKLGETV